MKKGSIIILSILVTLAMIVWFGCNPFAQQNQQSSSFNVLDAHDAVRASSDTGCIGFAQYVTGGEGGTVVNVATADDFSKALRLTGPTIIQITGHFVSGYPRCYADKTIIGIGSGAWLDGGVYLDAHANNVIIQNLKITSNSSSEDGVTIKGGQNVWVDHCTFVDCGDGSLDITVGANNITVSWCKFIYTTDHGHDFVNLIAASDSDSGDYFVTFHHNWWSTLCIERMPSVRFGHVHVFNNYYNSPGNDYCIRTRIDAQLLVQNNYFENVQNPWEQYITSAGGTPGKLNASGNVEVNCTWVADAAPDKDGNQRLNIPGTDAVFTPSYDYTLDDANSVKASVMAGAGSQGAGI
jgi:pectate lyase